MSVPLQGREARLETTSAGSSRARPPFTDLHALCRAGGPGLYRARDRDGNPVILEVQASNRPEQVDRLAHEQEITRALTSRAVLRAVGMATHDGVPVLVFEPFGGAPLDALLGGPMTAADFLRVAEPIADALAEIHREGVIHKDIKPENILVDLRTGEVKLAGFAIATKFPREAPPDNAALFEGTLAYMSPEQTGRMNRPLDRRSDLYSLGVVFFEMLTGRLPFDSGDAPGWVHCHVARPAPSPATFNQSIPEALATITTKLLSKTVEERYQTAAGLRDDLARCRTRLEESGQVEAFPLATHDYPDQLLIAQRLYGRARELTVLEATLQRVVGAARPELVLVSGPSGVGKSSLVHELSRALLPVRGSLVTAKLEPHGGRASSVILVQALRRLVLDLLAEREAELDAWRERLRTALGPNARLLIDIVPELALLLGPEPEVPSLGLLEDERRFQVVFTKLVGTLARPERPVVLFVDDLQWADVDCLQLLEHIITELGSAPLLVVGAYRDDEVSADHPLRGAIERVRAAERLQEELALASLSLADVTSLVADSLRRPEGEVRDLAELVFEKTAGNPFFVQQLLGEISRQRLLVFDPSAHEWRWTLSRIAAQEYAAGVVDLMLARLRELPPATLSVVEVAACAGSMVSEKVLATVSERSVEALRAALHPALEGGLLLRSGDTYRFAHDRVRQAASNLVPASERPRLHARVGRLLLAGTTAPERSELAFEIVAQLEAALPLLCRDEQRRLLELELCVGRKARSAIAYAAAARHFATGVALLSEDEAGSPLAFEIAREHAECELLAGKPELARALLAALRERARTKHQLADVVRAEIAAYVLMDRTSDGLVIGLECLRAFGVDWPLEPSWADIEAEYDRLREALGGRSIEELADLPAVVEPDAQSLMDVLTAMKAPVMFANGRLFCLVACRMAQTSLRFGNASASADGYLMLGMALVHFFDRFEEGYRFAKLGHDLAERSGGTLERGRAYLDFAIVSAWARPLHELQGFVERALAAAFECADVTHTCCIYKTLLTLGFTRAAPLLEVERTAEEARSYADKAAYRPMELVITSVVQLVRSIRGFTAAFGVFDDDRFDEKVHERALEASSAAIASSVYYVWKLTARYLAGEYTDALDAANKALGVLWSTPSFIEVSEHHYFHALTRTALCDGATAAARDEHLAALRAEQARFRAWSSRCPENFLQKHALIEAEAARVAGDHLEAERRYEQAIASAREQRYLLDEALALELAGRYYLARGFARFGETYLGDAHACYARWGAAGKVKQLERRYRQVAWRSEAWASAHAAGANELDLLSVTKASQTIAEETDVKELPRRLLCVVIEQGVARRACLLLTELGGLKVRAAGRSTETGIEAETVSMSASGSELVPEPLVNYVWRTREQVLLDDASGTPSALVPPGYVGRFRPRSVLCRPIVRRGTAIGLLYLENDLVAGAFTPDRVAALDVLSAQAAISLEIATSLEEERQTRRALERSESRFRRLYESNMIGICFGELGGRLTAANDYALSILGYTRQELESGAVRWSAIRPSEHASLEAKAMDELSASCVCGPFETQYVRKDGGRVPVFVGAAMLDGAPDETISFVVDMTERQRLFQKEQQARADAERALRAREEFMVIAAHELRTPLTPLKLQLRMLEESLSGELAARSRLPLLRLFELADRQLDRLGRLTEDLLDASRVETWPPRLELEEMDLSELAREVVERHRRDAERVGSTIELHTERPVVGRWDRTQLGKVLARLLANALKYGAGCPVTVTVHDMPDRAELSVRDRGIGIAPKDHERIFDRFERAVPVKHFGGFGLGLHICREIVRAHGGSIRVESDTGAGAEFTVELPLDATGPSTTP